MPLFSNDAILNILKLLIILIAAVIALIIYLLHFIIMVFFIKTLRQNYSLIEAKNRKMSGKLFWLNLIPAFDLSWIFITVISIAESNKIEFDQKNIPLRGTFGLVPGLFYAAVNLALTVYFCSGISIFIRSLDSTAFISIFIFILILCFLFSSSLTSFFYYWSSVAGMTKKINDHK